MGTPADGDSICGTDDVRGNAFATHANEVRGTMKRLMSFLVSIVLGIGMCVPSGALQAIAEEAPQSAGSAVASADGNEGAGAPAQQGAATAEAPDAGAQSAPDAAASASDQRESASDQGNHGAAASASDASSAAGASASADAQSADATAATDAAKAGVLDAAQSTVLWIDGTAGSDGNDGSSEDKALKTTTAAAAALKANANITKICLAGTFDNPAALDVPAGVAVEVAADTTMTGTTTMTGAGADGITLEDGASITCDNGVTLTMTGFKTALIVKDGAQVNDGSYALDGNYSAFALKGTGKIQGTSRDALTISGTKSTGTGAGSAFSYDSLSRFVNCTVNIDAPLQKSEEYAGLYLTNASLTTRGVWYYFDPANGLGGLHMDASDFTAYKATGSYSYRQVMSLLGTSEIKNGSTLTADGSRVTLSAALTVDHSKVVIRNSSAGGLNVNYSPASATFNDSTLETSGMSILPAYGAGQSSGPCSITFTGNSVVNTDAKDKDVDNGGANHDTNSSYVVTGGSYLVAYDPTYNHDTTTPTNGADNGNEWLSLLTLADPATNQVNPINANGTRYAYSVANASADGQKHVWVPAANVTFALNNGNATFADGTSADKTVQTVRGYTLGEVAGNDEAGNPGVPSDSQGTKFLGWFYRDAAGVEHAYDYATTEFDSDTEVYAKWDAKSIVYHNGEGASYIQAVAQNAASGSVLSFDDVAKQNDAFNIPGKKFGSWNTAPDGSGETVDAASALAFADGETQKDLYAQYTQDSYRVGFSANGGTFSDTSIFKQNPDAFTIEHDATGGEVAYLTSTAQYNQKLQELLGTVSHDDLTPGKAAASLMGSVLDDSDNWYSDPAGEGTSYRFDDYKLWFFTMKGDNPQITGDTIYYLKWKQTADVQNIASEHGLPSDMWGDAGAGSQADSTSVLKVTAGGDEFSLTGAVDVSSIKAQMESIESQFNEDASNFSNIKLANATSTFTATITLPDGVNVPENPQVQAKGLGSCFKVTSAVANGNTVTVTFGLSSAFTDYQQLKDAVESTGAASGAQSAIDPMKDAIELTVSGLTLDGDSVANGDDLTASGVVSGSFNALAQGSSGTVKHFSFTWNGTQAAAGKDERATDDATIQQTILVKKPYEQQLGADMQATVLPSNPTAADLAAAGTDTEHTHVIGVFPGSALNVTGSIDATSVKKQMTAIEESMGKTDPAEFSSIGISNLSSTFTATFTLPEGLSFPQGIDASKLSTEGFADTYAVKQAKVSGNTLTVTMGLKDGITNYEQLKNAVDALGDTLKVTVPGVVVDKTVADGESLAMTGTVAGTFDAVATSAAGTEKDFSFRWTGVQTPDGRDVALAEGDDAVQLTVKTPEVVQSVMNTDMLARNDDGSHDTENVFVYEVDAGSTVDLVGAVDTTDILAKMDAIEQSFGNPDGSTIAIDVRDFDFTAMITLDDGLSFPDSLVSDDVETSGFGNGFKVSSVDVSGQTATINFALAHPEDIRTYADLKSVVEGAGVPDNDGSKDLRWMKVIIPGIRVSSDIAPDANLSATGKVNGEFKALATSQSGTQRAYSFVWSGVQHGKYADVVKPDSQDASFTLKVKEAANPANPGQPSNPDQPSKPDEPSNPDQSGATDQPGSADQPGGNEPAAASSNAGNAPASVSGQQPSATGSAPQTGDQLRLIAIVALIVVVVAIAGIAFAVMQRRSAHRGAHSRSGRR